MLFMETRTVYPSPAHFFTKKDIKERSFSPSNFPLLPSPRNGEFDFLHARDSPPCQFCSLSRREKREGGKNRRAKNCRNDTELVSRPNQRIVLEMCHRDAGRGRWNIPIGARILNYRNPGTIHIHAPFVSWNCRPVPATASLAFAICISLSPSLPLSIPFIVSEGEIEMAFIKWREDESNSWDIA